MKSVKWLLVAGAIMMASAAHAEKFDLSTMTCKDFQASDKDTIMVILAWLDGFYKDPDAESVIDTDKFVENSRKLGEYCSANPTIGVGTAAEELFGKDD
jgi:acid stress chaperone HdeB